MWFDLAVLVLEDLSREELISLARAQAERIAEQDARIALLVEANQQLTDRLSRLEHLLSRNSQNSSMPPSRDDDAGRMPPRQKPKPGGSRRSRGK